MTISGSSPTTLLESALTAEKTRADLGVAVLEKAQDVTKQQGAAMVNLLEQAGAPVQNGHLDAYA